MDRQSGESLSRVRESVAGSVVVCDGKFLVLKKKSKGEIRLPKGKREDSETILETALRETQEESGYSGFTFVADLGTAVAIFKRKKQEVERTESYVLLELAKDRLKMKGKGEDKFDPRWYSFEKAIRRLSFREERGWARLALDRLESMD